MSSNDKQDASESTRKFSFVGASCGHHASYTFYKAIQYESRDGEAKILSLGEFFFVKIWSDSDLVSVGELQLLWEDKNTNEMLSSLRLYFLPEYTPEGRLQQHGEDEVVAVAEKAVLRVSDLLDWIAKPSEVSWDRGLLGVAEKQCLAPKGSVGHFDAGLNAKFAPGHSDFFADVVEAKRAAGDLVGADELAVVVLSMSQYGRYRGILKRIAGREKEWMHNSLIVALGGFTVKSSRTFIVFCRDNFDYPELEEHPYLCNHLAPKLKGRPRKRKKLRRAGSPESESASSESSGSTSVTNSNKMAKSSKKDLLALLCQKNTPDELTFLKRLVAFMDKRHTPIERPPMLGFKQIDLHLFYQKVEKLGGYDCVTSKKSWKTIYDDLGGNPQNTSAATCTRRHYEKCLLPFERFLRKNTSKKNTNVSPWGSVSSDASEKEAKSPTSSTAEASDSIELKSKSAVIEVRSSAASKAEMINDADLVKANGKSIEGDENRTEINSISTPSILAAGLQSLVEKKAAESSSQVKIDSDGKRLQIDDLIITPNQMHSPPEGGSALQNLAKIASRYQQQQQQRNREEGGSPSPKKLRLDASLADMNKGISVTQAIPPTTTSKKAATTLTSSASPSPSNLAAAAAASNIFSLLPPGLLPSWPLSGPQSGLNNSKSPASATSDAAAAAAALQALTAPLAGKMGSNPFAGLGSFPLGDPSKFGVDNFNLFQFYEKQLKAATAAASGSPNSAQSSSASPKSSSKASREHHSPVSTSILGSGSKKDSSLRDKDRSKVCKPPPDTKRPPTLLQTPCAFQQTTSIYTNPQAEIIKLRERASSSKNNNGVEVLDLSGSNPRKMEPLKREAGFGSGFLDLSVKREGVKREMKSSPFSAESLLSKPLTKSGSHDMIKVAPLSSLAASPVESRRDAARGSPAHTTRVASGATLFAPPSPVTGAQPLSASHELKARSISPWHTPVVTKEAVTKPAIPVSPVVREQQHQMEKNMANSLLGLLPASSTVTSSASPSPFLFPPVSSNLASLAALGIASSTSVGTSTTASSSFPASLASATNPYLAFMSQSMAAAAPKAPPGGQNSTAAAANSAAAAAAAAGGYPAHLMDPATSAYYAALYSQQVFGAAGLTPYSGLGAGIRPAMAPNAGTTPPGAGAPPPVPPVPSLDPLQASALQALLSRSSTSTSNPYTPYASLAGLNGYMGFGPPSRKDP